MRNCIVLAFSLLVCQWAAAQIIANLSGRVLTADSAQAVSRATVTVKSQSSIIAFAFTNENGQYSIKKAVPDTGYYSLEIKKLGFVTQAIPVHIAQANTLLHHSFYVEATSKPMEEVVINTTWKQRENKDTIEYNAGQFQTPQTRKVEDLLKNIDGFSVSQNGRISYRGKEVKALLVNGDDLTQDQYTLLSKNLNADVLDKIQVIDNYNSNRILGALTKSNEVAVNLKLKTDLFGKISGSLSAGYAPVKKYDADGTLMMLKARLTIIQLLAANNVSKNNAANVFFENENATGIALTTASEKKLLFQMPVNGGSVSLPPIPSEYTLHNQVKLSSTLFHLRLSKVVKASGKLAWFKDREVNAASSITRTVIDSNTKWQMSNEQALNRASNGLLATLNLLHDNTKNFTGSGSFKFLHVNRENLFTDVTQIAIADSLWEAIQSKSNLFAANYTGVIKAGTNAALSFTAFYNHLPGQSSLQAVTGRYAAYFSNINAFDHFKQQTNFWLTTSGIEMNFLQKRNNQSQKYSLSYQYDGLKGNNELKASEKLQAAQTLWNINNLLNSQQQAQLNLSRLYNLTTKISFKAVGFLGGNIFKKNKQVYKNIVWNVQTEATYKTKAFSYLSAALTSVKIMPSLQSFFPDSLLEGSGTVRFSALAVKPIQYNEVNVSYSYFRFKTNTSILATAWLRHSVSDYAARFFITPSFLQLQHVPVAGNISKGALLSGKTFIYPLRSSISFSTFLQHDKESKQLNDKLVTEGNLNLNYTLRLITGLSIPVNTELSYNYFLFKGSQVYEGGKLEADNHFFTIENKYRVQLSKKLYIGLQYNFLKPGNRGHHLASLFGSYQLSEKSSFDIKAHNLFNETNYTRNGATNNSSYFQSFVNVPFYILIRFNHSF